MEENARLKRNESRLKELYPVFAEKIKKVIESLEASGLRPRIQDAWRSPEDQLKAYNSGHSKLKFGYHNVTGINGKPEALAVDILDDNSPTKPGKSYLLQLAAASESVGLITGIRWGLPKNLEKAVNDAINSKNWKAEIKVGWDPTHVQPSDISVAEAKEGKRPV